MHHKHALHIVPLVMPGFRPLEHPTATTSRSSRLVSAGRAVGQRPISANLCHHGGRAVHRISKIFLDSDHKNPPAVREAGLTRLHLASGSKGYPCSCSWPPSERTSTQSTAEQKRRTQRASARKKTLSVAWVCTTGVWGGNGGCLVISASVSLHNLVFL